MMMIRKNKVIIDGVVLLDKPLGMSSNQAVNKVKHLLNANKAGHTGTLDPLATGLLPVCLGEATKLASYLLESDKEYITTIQMGIITSTGDAEGEVLARNQVTVDLAMLYSAIDGLRGDIWQTPPMYCALKHHGKPLYEYARAGIEIKRESRLITIHELELIDYKPDLAQITCRALVSKGTYIRSLAYDLGKLLGCGASLISLRRTKTNNFLLKDAVTLDELTILVSSNQMQILTPEVLVDKLPSISITDEEYRLVKNGNICNLKSAGYHAGEHKIYHNNRFLGIGMVLIQNSILQLHPKRMRALCI